MSRKKNRKTKSKEGAKQKNTTLASPYEGRKKPTTYLTKSLWNMIKHLFQMHPILAINGLFILWVITYTFATSSERILILLSIFIGLLSIGIYVVKKNFSEAILTMFLGLLAISNAKLEPTRIIIFLTVFFVFAFVYFAIGAFKLAGEVETNLTMASNFYAPDKDHRKTYKVLYDIARQTTEYQQMGVKPRSESIKFLSFIRVPIELLPDALLHIEMIATVFQISAEKAQAFYRSLFVIKKKTKQGPVTSGDLDLHLFAIASLPITPEEFLEIFDRTKLIIITRKLTLFDYFAQIEELVDSGYDPESIISQLLSPQEQS